MFGQRCEGAIQCGYCTPGMVINAQALLNSNENPSGDEIEEALAGNMCRCTGYTAIKRAVENVDQYAADPDFGAENHDDLERHAIAEGAIQLHDHPRFKSNINTKVEHEFGDVEQGFAEADYIVEETFVGNHIY